MLDRNELAMPTKDRVGTEDGRDLEEALAADRLRLAGESTPLVIVEPRRFRAVQLKQHPILLDQVFDRARLVAVEPASGSRNQDVQRRKNSVHARHDGGAGVEMLR